MRTARIPLLVAACVAMQLASTSIRAATRPNILFIYTDDHSHRTISCYPEAYDFARTPNIDALAAGGVRFASAYIGTWCMPSRATLLTGHLPYGVESMTMSGTYPGSGYDPKQCPFWPSVFRREGYVTGQIGKWHTGVDTGFGRDWDFQKVWNRPRYADNAGKYYDDQLIESNGGPPERVKGYTTDNYTGWADEFIRGEHRDPAKPWYLWLCYGAVHGPFTPADRHLAYYPGVRVPVPADIFPPRKGKPAYVQALNLWVRDANGVPELDGGKLDMETVEELGGLHGNTLHDWVRQYQQGVLAIDEGVGRLMQTLRETGQLENTLVVFTSDQGFAWGQHGFRHKLGPYDGTIRSPLIMSMPGRVAAGKVCESPVGGADIVPTFFSFAGLPLPWEMHGHDLTPVLQDPAAKWPHPVLTTLTGRKYGSDTAHVPREAAERDIAGVPWWVSLRQGNYKYIRTLVEGEIEELYDLQADPEELTNLALRKEHSPQVVTMREATLTELRRTGAKMVDDLPGVHPLPD